MVIPSKDKIDALYASLQEYFNIEDDGEIKKYIGRDLEHRRDDTIHISQDYLTQWIINIIPVMQKSSTNQNPVVKPQDFSTS